MLFPKIITNPSDVDNEDFLKLAMEVKEDVFEIIKSEIIESIERVFISKPDAEYLMIEKKDKKDIFSHSLTLIALDCNFEKCAGGSHTNIGDYTCYGSSIEKGEFIEKKKRIDFYKKLNPHNESIYNSYLDNCTNIPLEFSDKYGEPYCKNYSGLIHNSKYEIEDIKKIRKGIKNIKEMYLQLLYLFRQSFILNLEDYFKKDIITEFLLDNGVIDIKFKNEKDTYRNLFIKNSLIEKFYIMETPALKILCGNEYCVVSGDFNSRMKKYDAYSKELFSAKNTSYDASVFIEYLKVREEKESINKEIIFIDNDIKNKKRL